MTEPDLTGIDLSVEDLEPETADPPIELEATHDEDAETFSHVAPPDRRLITQPYDLSVSDLVGQVTSKPSRLHLSPVYQRRYVWDNKKASKLIESLLINVPIPVAYLAEETDGTRSVIDGQQRLRSFYRFLDNQFALSGLEVLPELNRKRFHELTDRQQRLIGNRTIRCIVISEDSDPDIRFDVFERLNTGSVVLNAQELRNSVYRGSFNDLLRELALGDFKRCLGNRADTRMTFEELALRFFALDARIGDYRPSLKRFLSNYLRDHRHLEPEGIAEKHARFHAMTSRALAVYEGKCFRRATQTENGWMWLPTLNSAVFDVVALNFVRCPEKVEQFIEGRDEIVDMTVDLMLNNEDFGDAISLATSDRTRLHRRVRLFGEGLARLGFDSGLAQTLPV